ncbi:MAG: DUF4224 domain-containing protein [Thioalkalivibrio sp.]
MTDDDGRLTLTREQLEEITGRRRYCAMKKWLAMAGFTFVCRADGMPLVSLRHFQEVMSGKKGIHKPSRTEPNWAALK